LARLVYAFAAGAVASIPALCASDARADPKASIEGALDPDLKAEVVRAVGR
jgi:hypothetical protein